MIQTLAKEKLYWICQVGGWLMFTVMELTSYLNSYGYNKELLVNAVVNLFLGIIITHCYRLILIKTGALSLPLYKIIPRGLLGVFLMSSILTAINIPLDRYTYPVFEEVHFNQIFMSYFFNLSKYVLLWALTYHLFQYWERSLIAEKEKYQILATFKENAYVNLKNQLNPHFLFNSLNSIRTLIDMDPKLAKTAINQLSGLLRSSLNTGKSKTIPLKDELETVKDYLAIEKIRFDDRLNWHFEVDPNASDCMVPPMMLQTLVENGVKHGVSTLKQGGIIVLNVTKNDNQVLITITNTGTYNPNKNTQGVGLENTRERLKLLYDEQASLQIYNDDASHTVITKLNLPL
jgi:two-component system LytT family sensor kinase